MVEHAQTLFEQEGLADRAELTCGDATHLPYESDSLDGIFFSFTLELFDTPEIPQVLAECKRTLKSGGRIVVVAVSKQGKEGMMRRAFEWMHQHFPNLMSNTNVEVRREENYVLLYEVTTKDGKVIKDNGTSSSRTVYKEQKDGSWLITNDIWNSNLPLPASK